MANVDKIRELLTEALKPTFLYVVDSSEDGCGQFVDIVVVSEAFDGVGILDRQKRVHAIAGSEIEKAHAVTMKCWVPDQLEKRKKGLDKKVLEALEAAKGEDAAEEGSGGSGDGE